MFFGFYSTFLVNNASSDSETEYNFLFKDNQSLIEENNIVIKNYSDTRGQNLENFSLDFDENTDFYSKEEIIIDYNNFNNGKIYGFTLGEGNNKLKFYGISDLEDFVSKIAGLEFSKNYTEYNKVFLEKDILSVKINFENGKSLELIDLVGFNLIPKELNTYFGDLTSEFSSVEGFNLQVFLPLLSQNLEFTNYDYKLENNLVLGEIFSDDGEKYSFIDKGYENIELLENEIIVKNINDTKLGDNFINPDNFENKDFGFGKSLFYDYSDSSGEIYGITVGDGEGANKIFFDNLSSNEELIDEINSLEFFKNYSNYNKIFLEKDFLTAKINFDNGNYLKLVDFVSYDSISDENFKQYIYNNSGSGKLSTDLYQATSEDIGDLDSLSSDKGEDIINYINNNNVCDIFKLEEDISYFGEDKLNTIKNNYHLPIFSDCEFEGNNILDFIVNNFLINNIDFLPDFDLVEENQKIILGKIFELSEVVKQDYSENDSPVDSEEENTDNDKQEENNQDGEDNIDDNEKNKYFVDFGSEEKINVSGEYVIFSDGIMSGEELNFSGSILNISGTDEELGGKVELSGGLIVEGLDWDGVFISPKIIGQEEFSIDELPENIEKEKVNQIVKIGAENGVSLKSEKDNLFEVSFKVKNGIPGVTYKVFKSSDLVDWEDFTSCELGENLICNFTTDSFSYFATQDSSLTGSCGTSQGKKFNFTPKSNLCSVGKASLVSRNGNNYSWACYGENGGEAISCSADRKVSSSGGGGGAGRGSYYYSSNIYQINDNKNISKKSTKNIDDSDNNEKKSVNNSNKNTKKELTSNQIKNIILNSKTKNYNINGYENKIRIPEFKDSKYEEKIILLSDSIIKLLEKRKLSNTKNKEFLKNYNYFLLGLKLTRKLDERGKLISVYSIKNLQKILK